MQCRTSNRRFPHFFEVIILVLFLKLKMMSIAVIKCHCRMCSGMKVATPGYSEIK